MIFNLFKTTTSRKYKLDEREKINNFNYLADVSIINKIVLVTVMIIYAVFLFLKLIRVADLTFVKINFEILIVILIFPNVIEPIFAMKNNAVLTKIHYLLGLGVSMIVSLILSKIVINNNVFCIVFSFIAPFIVYLIYVWYYNKHLKNID